MSAALPDSVAQSIDRCAGALGDFDRLQGELQALRGSTDARARLACALFDLERARRGDPLARASMLEVADALLVFWNDGSGSGLAAEHPVLEGLWERASELLSSFEERRLDRALLACWQSRHDPVLLQVAVEKLLPEGSRRVEFARCLYHLELARQFIDTSRAEFARRAALLAEAYQSEEVARDLVGDDPGLEHLWRELLPFLDEFFEHIEDELRRREKLAQPRPSAGARSAPNPFSRQVKTDPRIALEVVEAQARGPREVPSFANLVGRAPPPPPPPSAPRLPPVEVEAEAEVLEALEEAPVGPPPPPQTTPPRPRAITQEFEIDVVAPSPPTRAPRRLPAAFQKLDVAIEEPDPTPEGMAFWARAITALELLPDATGERSVQRVLSAESRNERRRLTDFLESMEEALDVPDARAFACLTQLMLAAQLKERGLFGQLNTRRLEAFAQALSLLHGDGRAAGHAAVFFVLDGPRTQAALHQGLEVLQRFLVFCAREVKDPLDPRAQAEFLEKR